MFKEKMESNPEEKIIRNIFGGRTNMETITLNLLKAYEKNSSNKPGSIQFVRELMGNYANKASAEEFRACVRIVNIMLNEIYQHRENIESSYGSIARAAERDLRKEAERAGFIDEGRYDFNGNKIDIGDVEALDKHLKK